MPLFAAPIQMPTAHRTTVAQLIQLFTDATG